ncbi:MAG: hypothetical protein K6E94_05405 [Elusimicrobiaceae bacterium]|nr:hypothetical protein [Elusimicrobiaceae bacterium]
MMKRKVLILGASFEGADAVSGIMSNITNYVSGDCEIYFCGYNNAVSPQMKEHDISINNPHHNPTLYFRIKRKIFNELELDTCIFDAKNILARLKKYDYLKFDLVLGVAGIFSFIEAAYLFAKKKNIP